MKKMQMQMGHFKKISEDDHHAVLKHPAGHEIKISKKGLSKELSKQLAGLPMHMAEGGDVDNPDKIYEDAMANDPVAVAPERAPAGLASDFGKHLRHGIENKVNLMKSVASPIIEGASDFYHGFVGDNEAPTPGSSAPQTVPSNPVITTPATQRAPQQQMPQMPKTDLKGMQGMMGAVGQGIREEAAAEGALGRQQAAIIAPVIEQAKSLNQLQQEKTNHLLEQRDLLKNDIANSRIDANHLISSKTDLGKISTAIGLILGGIGGALTGRENPAQKFLQSQIEQDIEAQKAELGRKENLLSANLSEFKNMNDAIAATRAGQYAIMEMEFKQAAAKAQDPIMKARAMQNANKWGIESTNMLMQLAQSQAQRDLMQVQMHGAMKPGANPMVAIQTMVPENQRAAAIKELGEYNAIQSQLSQLDKAMDAAFKNASLGEAVSSPLQSRLRKKQSFEKLFPIVKAIAGEKMSEGDAKNMIEPMLPGITTNQETHEAAKASLRDQLNSMIPGRTPILSGYGLIPAPKAAPAKNVKTMPGYRK